MPARIVKADEARAAQVAEAATEAPLYLVSHGPAILATHGVAFPCRATSAGRLPAVASAPVDAPARFAPKLSHPRQDRPRPFGRRAWPTPPRVRLLVSVRCEDTQHRSPGRRQTDAPHHQEERTRVATTLARRRRSGDAQAHRLIETYGYSGPREPAVDRLTTAELFVFDAPRRDCLELDTDASGEPVSWVAQAQIDRIIYHLMLVMFIVNNLTI